MKAENHSNEYIANKLGIIWVISKVCQKPKDHGYLAELWHPASVTRLIHSVAEKEGHPRMANVVKTILRNILANAKIRPFKISYYCEKRDPDFDSKMQDVFVVYKQISLQLNEDGTTLKPFEGTPVHHLSYDEKLGIQTTDSTAGDRPLIPGTSKYSTYTVIMNISV